MLVEVKVWDEKPAKRHSWHGGAAQQRSDAITHLQQSSLHSYGPQGDKMQCLAIPCLFIAPLSAEASTLSKCDVTCTCTLCVTCDAYRNLRTYDTDLKQLRLGVNDCGLVRLCLYVITPE